MQKGSTQSEEAKEKMRISKLMHPTRYWKGKKFSEEHLRKLSEAKKGKPGNNTTKGRIPWNKGKPNPDGYGKNSPLWKGGLANESLLWRHRTQNKSWRKVCLERDNYTCQHCGKEKSRIVHHIKKWVDFPDLRFDINNGITLCSSCHAFETWKERKQTKEVLSCQITV